LSEFSIHLYLSKNSTGDDDAVYATTAKAAIQLLDSGVVGHVTFGHDWPVSNEGGDEAGLAEDIAEGDCAVASFIRKAVLETRIPKMSWSMTTTDLVIRRAVKRIMEEVDEACRLRGLTTPESPSEASCRKAGIDPQLNFERFDVTGGNLLAQTYALLASMSPREERNPLMIQGGEGLGKTHLLNAIGNELLQFNPKAAVNLIQADEILKATSSQELSAELLERTRDLEMLLVDDVHLLQHCASALDLLDKVGARLLERGKQWVLTTRDPKPSLFAVKEFTAGRHDQGLVVALRSE